MTTAIFGSFVLAEEGGQATVLGDRWVLVEGRRIAAITTGRPVADCVLDAPGRFVLPGLLNLHNHCFSEAVARTHTEDGGARRANSSIVYTVLLPLSQRGIEILTREERLAVARLGIVQLLLGGVTTVMEAFRSGIPEMFDAAEELGIRFYGAPYLFSSGDARAGADGVVRYGAAGGGADDGAADLATWNALHAAWEGRGGGRIRLAMSPHAADTCGPDLLRAAAARARELGVPITTHLAQSAREVATIEARWGCTPAAWLDRLGVLGPDLLAAHCIASSDDDLGLMAARGAAVVNCPRVFARGGTTAAFGRFAGAGVRTLIGTDGYNLDLIGEMGAAAMVSKLAAGRADVANAPEIIDAVTREAAAAIGRPDLGAIRPGAAADLTVVDLTHPHLQPLHDPRRALVWLANRANVDAVMVDGRLLVREGRCVGIDQPAIVAAGATAIRRIWDLPEARAAFAG
jgi:cytosine/adenosine deaminase-related metal-dependent hydrolase